MKKRFKTELGCEVASNTFYGWLLGAFWVRIGSQILVRFPKLGILNSFKFACIAKGAVDAASGSFLEAICVNLGPQFWCN